MIILNFIGDFHVHTVASGDAFGTIHEVTEIAKNKNMKCIAVTDHGPAMPASSHAYYFNSLASNVSQDNGVKIYPGVEANIIDKNGSLDLPEDVLSKLSFIIASFHPFSWDITNSTAQNTQALRSCLLHYDVKAIAHMNKPYYKVNIEEIVPILIKKNICIELNNRAIASDKNNWNRFKKEILYSKSKGVKFIVSSDAHNINQVGEFGDALEFICFCGLEEDDIVNSSQDNLSYIIKK